MPQKFLRSSSTKTKSLKLAETRGALAAKKFAVKLKTRAITAVMSDRLPAVAKTLVKETVDELRDAMVYAHLLALRDTIHRRPVKASSYDGAIRAVNKQLKINLKKLQKKYDTRAFRMMNDVAEKMDRELRKVFLDLVKKGAHIREAREALSEKFEDLGLAPSKGFSIDTVFRTQSQIAYGAGSWEADQDEAVQEILWGYRYSATNDDRTRASHAALDGVTLPKDHPFWDKFWPPNGWNCRCQVIQLFQEEDVVEPPDDVEPDEGFKFNPGSVFIAI